MNPSRGKQSDYTPARVTVAVLTYVPNSLGYFENRLEVTKTCLQSIIKNTSGPYDLMVFDNASRPELVDYLRQLKDEGAIDFLMLSKQNIGKLGALQIMLRAAPGEVIAYSDDDVFYLPAGWNAACKWWILFPTWASFRACTSNRT
jgi:cellulose synthase/poly-beta-1,6-N-acetylglucosamine synthase-like glycosyltransferase